MTTVIQSMTQMIAGMGQALIMLGELFLQVLQGKVRMGQVLKQMYEQGIQSIIIIGLTSVASGLVLAMQGYIAMSRFGAKEYISHLVALSLVREMSPVFTALIFAGKAGAGITAELGSMSVNNQVLATRTMGVNPMEFLVVPRFLACLLVLPILTIFSEIMGIWGGYLIGVYEAGIPPAFYINQTFKAIRYIDFFSGFTKCLFFSILVGWICCYQGYTTRGGSLGVGRFTTKAVAFSYIAIIVSNTILTKIIIALWE